MMTYADAAVAARAAADRLLRVASPDELADVLDSFGVSDDKIAAVAAADDDAAGLLTRLILDKRAPLALQ